MSLLDTASLIVTPNGYKDGKLYSVIPSDGSGDLSVTRATTATRVNSAGLVELVPYNLLRYSEQFDNAAWAKETTVTVTPNVEIAPDGTLTADLINMPINRSMFQTFSIPAGEAATASVYIKGTAGETINFAVKSQNFTRVLTGEWQRIEATSSSAGTIFSVNRYSGGTASSFYLWGYQLVEGSVAKDYQKTETRLNIPRLDYSNGTCPSILVEPQRTNLLTWSEQFDNAAYLKQLTTVTANSTISPSGIQDADKVIPNTTNSVQHIVAQTSSVTNATLYTASCYIKAAEYTGAYLRDGYSGKFVVFNLSTGVVSSTSSATGTIEDVGNGWYRCTATMSSVTTLFRVDIGVLQNGSQTVATSYSGDGTSGIFVWGAQLEVGSYATSYIKTTSASVTRNADVISKTGISSLIGQTEGTLFVDAYITGKDSSNGSILLATDKVSSGAIMRILYTQTDALRFDVFDGSSFQCQISAGAFNVGDRVKIAGAYKNNDFVMYVNGTQIGTDTSGSVPATDTANINTSIYGDTNGSFIQASALWKTRLTNAQLATLTTI